MNKRREELSLDPNVSPGEKLMALIIDLKPSERVIIGSALITNDKTRTRLHIGGGGYAVQENLYVFADDVSVPPPRGYA